MIVCFGRIVIVVWLMIDGQREIRGWIDDHVRVHRGLRDIVVALLRLIGILLLVTMISASRPRDIVIVVIVIILAIVNVETLQTRDVVPMLLLLLLVLLLQDDASIARLVVLRRRGDVIVGVFQIVVTLGTGGTCWMSLAVIDVRQARAGCQSVSRTRTIGPERPVLPRDRRWRARNERRRLQRIIVRADLQLQLAVRW